MEWNANFGKAAQQNSPQALGIDQIMPGNMQGQTLANHTLPQNGQVGPMPPGMAGPPGIAAMEPPVRPQNMNTLAQMVPNRMGNPYSNGMA